MFNTRECPVHKDYYDHGCKDCRDVAAYVVKQLKETQIKQLEERAAAKTLSMQLTVTANPCSSGIAVSIIARHHTSRSALGHSELVSLRHISREEWDTDPIGCLEEELTLLVAPSVGVQ